MIIPFIMAGAGMALVFAPSANAILSSVRTDQAGQASGANNAIREVGGVLGVAVLASVFTSAGGYASPHAFVNGLIPAHVGRRRRARRRRPGRAGAPVQHARGRCERRAGGRAGGVRGVACAGPAAADSPRSAGRRRAEPSHEWGSAVSATPATPARRRRVPAAERREELIAAAVHEFAHGGLHGTPVDRIARRVGVAQPYVFSLFPNKRDLFLAALERSFERVAETFRRGARRLRGGPRAGRLRGLAACDGIRATRNMLASDRDYLMLQHQSYAACDDEVVRARVRRRYAELVQLARELSGADSERLDEFLRQGMALNVAAALGVEELSAACEWVKAENEAGAAGSTPAAQPAPGPGPGASISVRCRTRR